MRQRCDWSEFEHWAAFVAEPRNSPEEVARISGVPADDIRGAARLFAKGGNGAPPPPSSKKADIDFDDAE